MRILILSIAAGMIGHAYGFKHGVESSGYDRVAASRLLTNCNRLIYEGSK